MSYISWDKKKLVNLEYSLNREVLRSNAQGAFLATTVIGCNTRKYHGLLVVPQPQLDNNNHVLLSSLDETIIENKEEFHLGVHMYPDGVFAPRGHKYIRDFSADPMPKLTYRIGNVVLDKELIFSSTEARLFVRYTLREAVVPITLRVLPEWPKEPIAPKASGSIKVKYNTSKTGHFTKVIIVKSNDKEVPKTVLRINGTVVEPKKERD